MHLIAYITILRPANVFMASGAVCLGTWITSAPLPCWKILLLAVATACATGFGNIINDVIDVQTDRISHPNRPLPTGALSRTSALIYGILLAMIACFSSFTVGYRFAIGTFLPLLLLLFYALRLKATPLAGNCIVSLLVAYSLLFGSLGAPLLHYLFIPALLAMTLNFSREIIKDIQDEQGDRAAGIITSARLSRSSLRNILFICSGFYALLLFLPFLLGHFGSIYYSIVFFTAIPLLIRRLWLFSRSDWPKCVGTISLLLKIEMMTGLCALALDHAFLHN